MGARDEFLKLSGTNYVGGSFVRSTGTEIPVIDPATEQGLGAIIEPNPTEIDAAIAISREAQRSWWRLSALERAEKLHQVAQKLDSLSPLLGEAMSREMGKPFREAVWEPGASANAFRYFAELAKHDNGRVAGPAVAGQIHLSIKEPLGTVLCIVPYNFPILLFAWATAAALASGNAVIVKPSDLTSLTTLISMRAFDGLPPGLVQVLTGGRLAGQYLVAHPDTHGVAFTGTVENGRAIARACADQFKPCLIEASGNDAFLVMPSAPLELAVRGAAYAAFVNCGQVCTSAERFYVHRDIYDAFVDGMAAIANKLRIGRGLDNVDIGPLAARRERNRYEPLIARAVEQGAKICAGGKRPPHLNKGWFVEPTVLAHVTPDMDIVNIEPFGPVAPIVAVDSFDEAIALANRSKFGLGANIFTSDLKESLRAIHELETGIVWVNTPLNDNDAIPFGGRKASGIGRELGAEGLEQFRRSKMVMISAEVEPTDEWFPYKDDVLFTGDKG